MSVGSSVFRVGVVVVGVFFSKIAKKARRSRYSFCMRAFYLVLVCGENSVKVGVFENCGGDWA